MKIVRGDFFLGTLCVVRIPRASSSISRPFPHLSEMSLVVRALAASAEDAVSDFEGSGSTILHDTDKGDNGTAAFVYIYVAGGIVILFGYTAIAFMSWPSMRYRTGWPILLLALALLFPPLFFVLIFYVLLFHFWWVPPTSVVDAREIVIVESKTPRADAVPSVLSQSQRREMKR